MSLVFPPLTPDVRFLLSLAMFPDPARIEAALAAYRSSSARRVCGWMVGGQLRCAAGLLVSEGQAEILHIGTHPECGGRGYARDLLHAVLPALDLSLLWAETDDDAVGFYRRAGFEVEASPSRWPGSRYRCSLGRSIQSR